MSEIQVPLMLGFLNRDVVDIEQYSSSLCGPVHISEDDKQ